MENELRKRIEKNAYKKGYKEGLDEAKKQIHTLNRRFNSFIKKYPHTKKRLNELKSHLKDGDL